MRELENFVERLVVLSDGPLLTKADVQREIDRAARGGLDRESVPAPAGSGKLDSQKKSAEREALVAALARAGGNRTVAARLLGVSRRTLYYKLEEHRLTDA